MRVCGVKETVLCVSEVCVCVVCVWVWGVSE